MAGPIKKLLPPVLIYVNDSCSRARVHMTRRVHRWPSRGGGGSGRPPAGKISKNEAKSCILSEKGGSGHPGTQMGHAPDDLLGSKHMLVGNTLVR